VKTRLFFPKHNLRTTFLKNGFHRALRMILSKFYTYLMRDLILTFYRNSIFIGKEKGIISKRQI
jgi:hypothetical protein